MSHFPLDGMILTAKVQNCGQTFDKGLEPTKASYHVLRYGVLTARGMAAGKSVCTGLGCPRTREKEISKNKNDSSLESNMVGKQAWGIRAQELCRG